MQASHTNAAAQVPAPRPYWRLLRPKQWVKNLFVLAPLIFSDRFGHVTTVLHAFEVFLAFCAMASAVYIVNDIMDRQADRNHPVKRFTRPIAACQVSVSTAAVMATVLAICAIVTTLGLSRVAGLFLVLYCVINLLYSFRWKHVAILDLVCVSTGFVLRVVVGSWAIGAPPSGWIVLVTGTLALYLASTKRLQEVLRPESDRFRRVLNSYSPELLKRYMDLAANATVASYSLFALAIRPILAWTIPLVIIGILRYYYLQDRNADGESPTDVVWKDLPLDAVIGSWALLCLYLVSYR